MIAIEIKIPRLYEAKKYRGKFWYYFLTTEGGTNFQLFMSQEPRQDLMGNKDISRTATEGRDRKNHEGFEGMNYEQVREPYNSKNNGRNGSEEQRKNGNRPDEC